MNLHKSKTAIFDTINEAGNTKLSDKFDIICIQEPWTDSIGNTRSNPRWHILYPTSKLSLPKNKILCSVILVNKRLTSNSWKQLEVNNTNDITAIEIQADKKKIAIFNIYNDCNHSETLKIL
ncbi:hypothetical protein K435DRAFT_680002 [Dendrothele bispora CBS 962.96]|uniref:Endonuclease/exonuclease/phosphatase domain-containing protein n=1 Tax=Dendrothele bispora (strain CBS 962.96) TaxID=1314807 RepID=A0A4S8LH68_DENBC|nr:hypothetical protein K435DRAFT_680002 [Dendrothele bispora CBS 962.96]